MTTKTKTRTAPVRAVDLFAGYGGFSLGAEQAGADVVWAANHNPMAVDAHQRNHPHTVHACQDLRQADWSVLPRYDLLLASPACQGMSSAGQPGRAVSEQTRKAHDTLRATAWAVIDCAEVTAPKAILVENVAEFRSEWKLYRRWRQCLEDLGYTVSESIVRASTLGVPQRRDRLFIAATRKAFNLEASIADVLTAEPAFGPCVDWEDPEGRWKLASKASPKIKERIAHARQRYGRRALFQLVTGHKGLSLDGPIRTITTKCQWRVLDGPRYRPLTVREYGRAMGFPDTYGWPPSATKADRIKGLGNAVCPPVARELVSQISAAL
jgi:DNA (cytosine-5)-methyltransferase 1